MTFEYAPEQRAALLDAVTLFKMLGQDFDTRTAGCLQHANVIIEFQPAAAFDLNQCCTRFAKAGTDFTEPVES
ncbi:Uncharacterized protein ALO73_03435 [Pseudomonas syringae pv. daphniphylli]|uniref:Uncharacterized protein n=1 Tax=Pseudomonas syringae pv. daphniphylli TaxID=264455 RepID=A0A9X0H167_PSESX|nr:Uncharacterized protein ALO73_03435 [Pseudomonas syringae pv. daphniphylli]